LNISYDKDSPNIYEFVSLLRILQHLLDNYLTIHIVRNKKFYLNFLHCFYFNFQFKFHIIVLLLFRHSSFIPENHVNKNSTLNLFQNKKSALLRYLNNQTSYFLQLHKQTLIFFIPDKNCVQLKFHYKLRNNHKILLKYSKYSFYTFSHLFLLFIIFLQLHNWAAQKEQ